MTRCNLDDAAADPASQDAEGLLDRLFADWLTARAAVEFLPSHVTDDEASIRIDRMHSLARDLVATPAVHPWDIWKKFEVLEFILIKAQTVGPFGDNREVAAVASLKADLLSLGIGCGG